MRHTRLGAVVPALALVLALAAAVWADCAPYISTGPNDPPGTGTLIGSETRTETLYYSTDVSTSGSVGASSTSLGGSTTTSTSREVSRTYSVGTYRMSDGSTLQVDCSTYTVI